MGNGRGMPIEGLGEGSVWEALFEHTPTPIRYLLGVLTLGLFSLTAMLWRWNRADLKRVEDKVDKASATHRKELNDVNQRLDQHQSEVTRRLDQANVHLIAIAHNTAPPSDRGE